MIGFPARARDRAGHQRRASRGSVRTLRATPSGSASRNGSADKAAQRRQEDRVGSQARHIALLPVQFQRIRLSTLLALTVVLAATAVGCGDVLSQGSTCTNDGVPCGIFTGVFGIAVVTFVGLAAFIGFTCRISIQYQEHAEADPHELLHVAPTDTRQDLVDSAVMICDKIAPRRSDGLRRRRLSKLVGLLSSPPQNAPPQLVVGQAGEGKTTLLVQLARELALRGRVPVAVSLRDVSEFRSFLALARDSFAEAVDKQLASNDEGDRVWRWLCWSGQLVVLVDDLQLLHGSTRMRIVDAFREAERRNYGLVVTSRRDGVGAALEGWQVPIDQLSEDDALVETRDGADFELAQERRVASLIRHGELHQSYYYLAVIKRLRGCGLLSTTGAAPGSLRRFEIRRWLLALYVDAFLEGRLTRRNGLAREELEEAVREIRERSYKALLSGEEATVRIASSPLAHAVEAGLLRALDDEYARVEHALLQSYLASGAIAKRKRQEKLVRNRAGTPEARDALLFFACADTTERHERAVAVVDELLTRSPVGADAVSSCVTAADIVDTVDAVNRREEIVQELDDVWRSAGTIERLALVDRLARIPSGNAIVALWEKCDDGDYRISWAAGTALTGEPRPPRLTRHDRATQAATILAPVIEGRLLAGEAFAKRISEGRASPVDDWDPEIRPLKRLGWILPVLVVGADQPDLFGHLDRLLALFHLDPESPQQQASAAVGPASPLLTEQLGPEASIAQGLKAAARLVAWDPPARLRPETIHGLLMRILHVHRRARFWYSQLVVLHGLTDLAFAANQLRGSSAELDGEADRARALVELAALRSPCGAPPHSPKGAAAAQECVHPFVVEAARLCARVLRELSTEGLDRARAVRDQLIWDDEGVAVGGSSGALAPEALRLLGDVAILLNLNEKGPEGTDDEQVAIDRERRYEFGLHRELPACLSTYGDRERLFSPGTACGCPIERCPYPQTRRRAHREISRLFCQRISEATVDPPEWQSMLTADGYRRFWQAMERQAKYTG